MVKNQFNQNIKIFRSDGGGEYTSTQFQNYTLQHGIIHQTTCPHTPEQNGVSERKNRHIMETARTLLSHSSIPYSFWLEAATTATYLINRLPTKILNMDSPYYKLYKQHPLYSHLKTFGCLCFPWMAYSRKHKLEDKSNPCTFLGYSENQKGFRCYDKLNRRLIISRHVKFFENNFPYSILDPNEPTSPINTPIEPSYITYESNSNPPPLLPNPPNIPPKPHIQYKRRKYTHITQPLLLSENTIPQDNTMAETQPNYHPHGNHQTAHLPQPESHTSGPNSKTAKPKAIKSHPMQTRSSSKHLINMSNPTTDPTTYKQAQDNPNWINAMQTEIQALHDQNTWDLIPKPKNQTILGSKWTYKTKLNPDGSVSRYKARLVAQGFRQTEGLDYNDTFSPVAKITTIRLFFIIALQRDWDIRQIDVSNAFLHGELKELVYMTQPKGFEDPSRPNHVCKLNKSLYGLKQSSREWNLALTTFLKGMGFTMSTADPSLYIFNKNNIQVYILIYVDDILISGNQIKEVQMAIAMLGQKFHIRDLGRPQVFLGIQTESTPQGFLLHQTSYASSIVHLAGLDDCTPVLTPLPSKDTFHTITSKPFNNPKLYRRIVGSLQYLVITRPDIAHAVNIACQFMHDPQDHHFCLLTRIIRYIKGSSNLGLPIIKGQMDLIAYTDSDWAGDPTDRTSTTGYCLFLGPNLLTWKTQKQKSVARSSSEAEYRALSSTITEIIWVKRLLEEFLVNTSSPTMLYCDNTSAINIAKNPILKARTKHVEIDHHFIREHLASGSIIIKHISTNEQIADIFTKRLPKQQFQVLCNKLTIQRPDHELEGG